MSYTEKAIEQKLRDSVKTIGGQALKFTSPGTTGVPDRIVLVPDGRVYFVELKAPGKTMSPKQIKMMTVLAGLGHKVWLIDSPEGVKEFINAIFSA